MKCGYPTKVKKKNAVIRGRDFHGMRLSDNKNAVIRRQECGYPKTRMRLSDGCSRPRPARYGPKIESDNRILKCGYPKIK